MEYIVGINAREVKSKNNLSIHYTEYAKITNSIIYACQMIWKGE